MADFASCSQQNLAAVAADQQAAMVALNNANAHTLGILQRLAQEYAKLCDEVCKVPVRNPAYIAAIEELSK